MIEQPRRSSRFRQESELGDSSDRQDERRAAVAQMLAENRVGLGMKVITVMVQRYGVLPRELWDLNSISDMGAGRAITYNEELSEATFNNIITNERYRIVNLTIERDVSHEVSLPGTLRRLNILAHEYNYPLDLGECLQELTFGFGCNFNQPLILSRNLEKLVLGRYYDLHLALPSGLLELKLGPKYSQPLLLPPSLERLVFASNSEFDHPLALPASLILIEFGNSYNQATLLPPQLEELLVGEGFTRDLSLPATLRKLEWRCHQPVQIPGGVVELGLWSPFNHPVVFPAGLKSVTFVGYTNTHPLNFPPGLEELKWYLSDIDGVVLPEGVRTLIWESDRYVGLPSSLRDICIIKSAPLTLPEGILKVSLGQWCGRHYDLPESVREVACSSVSNNFTHPSTLPHLRLCFGVWEVDLSNHRIDKLTIGHCGTWIKQWPQGLQELAFNFVDPLRYPFRIPEGCRIVGEKRPPNIME